MVIKLLSAKSIIIRFEIVNIPIYFYNQPRSGAIKIGYERPNDFLAAKFQTT